VEQHGRTMAMVSATMESPDGGTKYATAQHHKVHVPTRPEFVKSMREWWREREGRGDRGVKL